MIRSLLASTFALGVMGTANAQFIWEAPQPESFKIEAFSGEIPNATVLETPNMEVLAAEDLVMAEEKGRSRGGVLLDVQMDLLAEGEWFEMTDGSKYCRATFFAEGAKGTKIYFNNYNLAEGATLNVFSGDRSHWDGPYTAENSGSSSNVFVSGTIFGEEIVVEYYEPAQVEGNSTVGINHVAYMYTGVEDPRISGGVRGSEACQIDVICPDADEFRVEVDATVRLEIVAGGNIFFCSASLVNNTAFDETKYLYSAYHCIDEVEDDEFALMQVRFNYERSSCGGGFGPSSRERVGVIRRASSANFNSGSDFALLEMEDDIDANWPHFYAGWSSVNAPGQSGVGIHHPAGDYKKISGYTNNLSNANGGTNWRVVWAPTESGWGVTEQGSSGSPIYNQDHHIVGSLSTGASFCSNQSGPDFYGKFSYAWNEGNADSNQLEVWLDPDGTGDTTVEGSYDPENGIFNTSVENDVQELNAFKVFPNPSKGVLNIASDFENKMSHVLIFDMLGKQMDVWGVGDYSQTLDLSHYPAGLYVIKAFNNNIAIGTESFVIE